MFVARLARSGLTLGFLGSLALSGCGDSGYPTAPGQTDVEAVPAVVKPKASSEIVLAPPRQDDLEPEPKTVQKPLPTVSISAPQEEKTAERPEIDVDSPQPGTAEWAIGAITRIRVEPLPNTENPETLRMVRQERNAKIIELATEAIALTHSDPEQERLFTLAVHHLLEAQLQLAIQGDRESIDALYENTASLYERDPKSRAAAEAAYTLAKLAHTNARRGQDGDPRWLQEYARQAQLFAAHFPHEQARAIELLNTAGWSCELHNMVSEAVNCYTLIKTKFPESMPALQATAILRRLGLKGNRPEIAGPTHDGQYINIDKSAGKVVLVVFWSSESAKFQEHLPAIQQAARTYKGYGLELIGVNLDSEDETLQRFLEQHGITWPQIYYPDAERRRWNHPTVKYYGVRDIPTYWLVDAEGKVAETQLKPQDLEAHVRKLLSGRGRSAQQGP